jgi:hypothetical protein
MIEKFLAREGHAKVPQKHVEDGVKLGKWVTNQRTSFRIGKLSTERVERLAALPGWEWDAISTQWEFHFGLLEQFVAREGHAKVPAKHVEDGVKLGIWVNNQKRSFRRGKLSKERAECLAALPGWEWNPTATQWEFHFGLLEQFVEREGHAKLPQRHVEAGVNLGKWGAHQRRYFGSGELSKKRAGRLASLPGWEWDPLPSKWESSFRLLEIFVSREGDAKVPGSHVEDGVKLGAWVGTQRRYFGSGKLSKERAERLAALPGWEWDPLTSKWESSFRLLEIFVSREGDAKVPQKHVEDGVKLGTWVATQRRAYIKGDLSEERQKRLETLPGWEW